MIGTPEYIGHMNRRLILSYLQKNGPQTRKAISSVLGLSFPSVSANIDALMEKNLVHAHQQGLSSASSGRKPMVFEFNANWGNIVSIDIGRRRIRLLLSNALGHLLHAAEFTPDASGQDIILQIQQQYLLLLRSAQVEASQVKHVSFSVPGLVSRDSGQLMLAPFIHESLRNTRIDLYWADTFKVRTSIQNNVNLAAIAERWQGAGQGYANIAYIEIAMGVGSALIINGEMVTGHHGAAGEIAYMLPGTEHRRDHFEEEGALEDILSAYSVEQRMRELAPGQQISARDLFEEGAERTFHALLGEVRKHLAMTLVNISALVDPEILIVGGGFGKALATHFPEFFEGMLRNHLPFPPRLVPAALDGNASAVGGLAFALRLLHDEPGYYE